MREKHPFAVVGTQYLLDIDDDQPMKGRAYPWGVVEIENPEHSDLTALRELLIKGGRRCFKKLLEGSFK